MRQGSPQGQNETVGNVNDLKAIGMNGVVGWYVSAAMFGAGGAVSLILGATGSAQFAKPAITLISYMAVAWGIVAFFGARLRWGTKLQYVSDVLGITFISTGALSVGRGAGSAAAILLCFVIISHAYLGHTRRALPFVIGGESVLLFIIASSGERDAAVHTIVTGGVVAFLFVTIMISQSRLRKVAAFSRRLSLFDSLTGVANMRQLKGQIEREIRHNRHGQHRLSLIAIDLDDFKRVNDQFNHSVGDRVLIGCANAMVAVLQPGDLLARRGGDEFAVLIVDTGERDIDQLCVRLRSAIEAARTIVCPELNPRSSVAYVEHREDESAEELISRGDNAQHDAKQQSRLEQSGAVLYNMAAHRQRIASARNATDARQAPRLDHRHSSRNNEEELAFMRWAQRSLGTSSAWSHLSVIFSFAGLSLLTAIATGLSPELHGPIPTLAAGGLIALAPVCQLAGSSELPNGFLHLALIGAIVLIDSMILTAGSAQPAVVDLLLLPTLLAFYFFKPRGATPYLAVNMATYVAVFALGDFAYAAVRVGMTAVVVVFIAAMLAATRNSTRRYIRKCVATSELDALTGAANLRGLRLQVSEAIEFCEDSNRILALVTIDLDSFKQVNDRHSHTVGDEVLVASANAIRSCVRGDELVARRGGDEFTVVCFPSQLEEIEVIADRIRNAIETTRLGLCPDITGTASVGYIVRHPGENSAELLERADHELHNAKTATRVHQLSLRPGRVDNDGN